MLVLAWTAAIAKLATRLIASQNPGTLTNAYLLSNYLSFKCKTIALIF